MRAALRALAVALVVAGGLHAHATAAAAYPSATVELSGHGYGHGNGLGQWGSLGYALDFGWTYQRVLDHFYQGTASGSLGPEAPITVNLTGLEGADTVVQQERGQLTTSAAGGTYTALRARRVGANDFVVDQGPTCAGPWTRLGQVAGPVVFSPVTSTTEDRTAMLQVCEPAGVHKWLRGEILAVDEGGVQRAVNRLGMESYLRGVVPRESPASWGSLGGGQGMHALRAQAVAARSYAAAENRTPAAKTCDTTSCQVYDGVAIQDSGGFRHLEHPNTDAAVRDTAGQVRRFSTGAVARTEFSSSTGGWTAGGTFPAVPDEGDATRSPYHSWEASIPVRDIEAAYPQLGVLLSVEVTQRNGLGEWGGRVRQLALRGSSGTVSLTGPQFRFRFGLRSDWFLVRTPSVPLNWLLRDSNTPGPAQRSFTYGRTGDQPLACDWDGNATSTPGVRRSGSFFLRHSVAGGAADQTFAYGRAGDVGLCGDWDGNGTDTVGVVRDGVFHLRNTNGGGVADVSFGYGRAGDVALAGDWDGNGTDTVGVVRDGVFHLRNTNGGGVADVSFGYGRVGDVALAGDWDGSRTDTVGVVRG